MSLNPKYLQPGTEIAFYRVVDQLGTGGLGAVYKVERDGRPYALKISTYSLLELGPEERGQLDARAKREFGALAQLSDRHIVNVHEFFRYPTSDGYPVLVMDYVEGAPLYTWQAAVNPSLKAIATVFIKLAGSLNQMHERAVFHRDLKSGNVLVKHESHDPVIIDFNIARPGAAYTLTVAGGLIGTPVFFTPEYCEWFRAPEPKPEFEYGRPQELHCVGFMLYEMLSGRPPRPAGEDSFQTMGRIERLPPMPLEELVAPGVPPELCNIAMTLLKQNPQERFQSGNELKEALESILDRLPAAPFQCPLPKRPDHPSSTGSGAKNGSSSHEVAVTRADRPRPRRQVWPVVLAVTTAVAGGLAAVGFWWNSKPSGQPVAQPPISIASASLATKNSKDGEEDRAAPPAPSPRIVQPEEVVPTKATTESVGVPTSAATATPIVPAPSAAPIPLLGAHKGSPTPGGEAAPGARRETSPSVKSEAGNGVLVQVQRMNPVPEPTPAATGGAPAGTHFSARLSADVVAVAGQRVEAALTRPFIFGAKTIFPSRTRVTGSVASVDGPLATLRFRTAVLPDGREVSMDAQAVPADLQAGANCDLVLDAAL